MEHEWKTMDAAELEGFHLGAVLAHELEGFRLHTGMAECQLMDIGAVHKKTTHLVVDAVFIHKCEVELFHA